MDIHIILNPGLVGSRETSSKIPLPRRGTPTSVQSSPGSTTHRRGGLRKSSPGTLTPVPARNTHATTTLGQHSTPQQSASRPRVRQVRPRKHPRAEEHHRQGSQRGRSSSGSTTASTSGRSSRSLGRLRAAALVSRARLLVAAEAEAEAGGRRTRSLMDVVLDMKAAADVNFLEDVRMGIAERLPARPFVFPADERGVGVGEAIAVYWAEQAALWCGMSDDARAGVMRSFPVSRERSTV